MAKNVTPAMLKIQARSARHSVKRQKRLQASPLKEAWRRMTRNKTSLIGLIIMAVLLILIIFAPLIAPYEYDELAVGGVLQGPSLQHLFGTDELGRDMLSRCIYGARITLPIAFCAVAVSIVAGGVIGVVSAYFGGSFDNIVMRIVDIWGSIPGMLLSVAIVACLGNNITVLVLGLSVGAVPGMARMFRGAIFTVVDSDYVESSKAIGAKNGRVMFIHLLPNSVGPVILSIVNLLGMQVLSVSTLSFLGVGISPPIPEWGALLSAGKTYISTYPHLCLFPGLCIMVSVLGFNLIGDGLRDALDPRLK